MTGWRAQSDRWEGLGMTDGRGCREADGRGLE